MTSMKLFSRYILLHSILFISLMVVSPVNSFALEASHYAANSVLSEGRWGKISVTESGMYSISRSQLARWGFSDFDNVKIFGYGGAPISTTLNDAQIDDLPQIPVLRLDDRIIFYAQGPTTWRDANMYYITYRQYQHPYATAGYYFITDRSDIKSTEITSEQIPIPAQATEMSTFTEHIFYEQELFSPGETGNYLLGDDFRYNTSQTFDFTLDGYKPKETISVLTSFGAAVTGSTSSLLTFTVNGDELQKSTSDEISALRSEYDNVRTCETVKQFSLEDENLKFGITFTYGGSVSIARLDHITINYVRMLDMNGQSSLQFRTDADTRNAVCNLSGTSENTRIWDVTTSHTPIEVEYATANNDVARFAPSSSGHHEYVAFNEDGQFPTPSFSGMISNQNLHANEIPDMIIISPQEFLEQAERIADMHRQLDTMRVLVVDHSLIFNEFSSGTPDVMAYRKLAKMFFDRGTSSDGHKLGYLLLFGRGSYDNRGITQAIINNPYPRLLLWQSDTGANEQISYCSDDIIATLSDGSSTTNVHSRGMDIALGRMPVKSVSEASDVVDKLLDYVTGQDFGSWKNNIVIVADDSDSNAHMIQADSCINELNDNGGTDFVVNRLYTDSYPIKDDGSGNKYPDARNKLFKLLDDGALSLIYIGHANPVSWTHEGLLNITDMNNMYLNHLPMFFTATCEFTRFDADDVSGGEILFLNPRGGAISLVSTTRVVYIGANGDFAKEFGKHLFERDENGNFLRMGDIYTLTKNGINDTNKLRYVYVGDPAMRLAYPTSHIAIESINGIEPTEETMPEFKARQTITVKGSIYDTKGNKDTSFNGTIYPTLFDAEQTVTTYGNQENDPYMYNERSNKLAITKGSVQNGEFTFSINIPSEVDFSNYSPALLNLYAYSDNQVEANGSNSNFYIYGYDETVEADTTGPDIRTLFLNSESFADGSDVNESPLLVAEVYDESGISFSTTGIGHQMTILLDNKTTYSDVSSYFTPEISPNDSSESGGFVYYPLEDLTEGMHTLRFKVWDTFANSSERTISFNVVNGLKPELYDVYTTSNPASVEANFYLRHNRPDAMITVTLEVFNLMGQLMWSTQQTGRSEMFTSFPITWDLTDNAGRRVQRGIYVYKAGISTDGTQESTKAKKIAVAAE